MTTPGNWNEAHPDKRWVCSCCGKTTELGEPRDRLRDTSCVMWAVLCHAERDSDGHWVAVSKREPEQESG